MTAVAGKPRFRSGSRGPLAYVADLIWPPRSLLSENLVSRPGAIEPDLWAKLTFLSKPCCQHCGFPFETAENEGALCGPCAAKAPVYRRARAAVAYDDLSRALVLEMKHGARRDGLPVFAAWMANAAAELVADADIIAPAPLHWTRLASRRFNQAAWLAQALGKVTGKKVAYGVLIRVKGGKSQAGLDAAARRRNVAGAFRVRPAARKMIEGKSILLVDDVFTTGATAEACARALKRGGAAATDVVTLARVVRPSGVLI